MSDLGFETPVRNKSLTCYRNDSKRVGMADTIPRLLMDAFSLDNLLQFALTSYLEHMICY